MRSRADHLGFLNGLGQQVLPAHLSLDREDPLRPRIGGSRPFDGEGLFQLPRVVENGVLMGWDAGPRHVCQLGLQSTGNAVRGTSAPPTPSSSNLDLTQGEATRAELIRDMGTGLLITSMIGSTINPTGPPAIIAWGIRLLGRKR